MAKKTVKKVDVKKVSKIEVSAQIKEMFEGLGIVVGNGQDFGFTEGTLVLKMDKCDVQVKLITPKAGLERYESLVEDEEEEVSEETPSEEVDCKHSVSCINKEVEICDTCPRNKNCKAKEEDQMDFLEIG